MLLTLSVELYVLVLAMLKEEIQVEREIQIKSSGPLEVRFFVVCIHDRPAYHRLIIHINYDFKINTTLHIHARVCMIRRKGRT